MLKKFDKYDKYSIITLILSVIICLYLVYRGIQLKKADDDILILSISIISSVVSIGGLLIAVLQIFKVAGNTKIYKEAYDKIIENVNTNESISLLSKSLQQLLIIKQLFETQSEISSRNYFNTLLLDLTFLKENKDLSKIDKEALDEFIIYCKQMDTLIYKAAIKVVENVDYSVKYETLTEIQSFLIALQQKLTIPKE